VLSFAPVLAGETGAPVFFAEILQGDFAVFWRVRARVAGLRLHRILREASPASAGKQNDT
jgi:hypothetical protein